MMTMMRLMRQARQALPSPPEFALVTVKALQWTASRSVTESMLPFLMIWRWLTHKASTATATTRTMMAATPWLAPRASTTVIAMMAATQWLMMRWLARKATTVTMTTIHVAAATSQRRQCIPSFRPAPPFLLLSVLPLPLALPLSAPLLSVLLSLLMRVPPLSCALPLSALLLSVLPLSLRLSVLPSLLTLLRTPPQSAPLMSLLPRMCALPLSAPQLSVLPPPSVLLLLYGLSLNAPKWLPLLPLTLPQRMPGVINPHTLPLVMCALPLCAPLNVLLEFVLTLSELGGCIQIRCECVLCVTAIVVGLVVGAVPPELVAVCSNAR